MTQSKAAQLVDKISDHALRRMAAAHERLQPVGELEGSQTTNCCLGAVGNWKERSIGLLEEGWRKLRIELLATQREPLVRLQLELLAELELRVRARGGRKEKKHSATG